MLVWVACEGLQGCGFPVLRPRDLSRLQHFPASTFPPALHASTPRANGLFLAVVCLAELAGAIRKGRPALSRQHFPASTFPPALPPPSARRCLFAPALCAIRQHSAVAGTSWPLSLRILAAQPSSTFPPAPPRAVVSAAAGAPALSRQHFPASTALRAGHARTAALHAVGRMSRLSEFTSHLLAGILTA